MDLPHTLYGQLYLLAYDCRRHRFDFGKLWLLGYALRGAILTELVLGGHLRDAHGMAQRTGRVPADPVLRTALETIDDDGPPRPAEYSSQPPNSMAGLSYWPTASGTRWPTWPKAVSRRWCGLAECQPRQSPSWTPYGRCGSSTSADCLSG